MDTLTAGELKKLLDRIPEDTPIYYERIEDVYFKKHHWEAKSLKSITFLEDLNNEIGDFVEVLGCKYDEVEKSFKLTAHF